MLSARLAEECDRYGLPHDFDALLRHIYANRDATYAAKEYALSLAANRIEELEIALRIMAGHDEDQHSTECRHAQTARSCLQNTQNSVLEDR